MQVCDLEPEGSAPWELLRKYGGKFGFFEKIKMGGVDSPKIIYSSGLPELDQFVKSIAGSDIPYVNFEYLKNGILARVNKTQYLKGLLISFDEIDSITLSRAFKFFRKKENSMVTSKRKIDIGEGKLEIKIDSGEVLIFPITVQSDIGIEKFFKKINHFKENSNQLFYNNARTTQRIFLRDRTPCTMGRNGCSQACQ